MASEDVLDTLKELGLVSIKDIQTALINDCQPLVENGSYEQEEEDAIMVYYASLVHLLLSSTPLGRSMNSEPCISDNNIVVDDERWDLEKLNGMGWLQHMKQLLHHRHLAPPDFYTVFMDSCQSLRTLAPPLWVRYRQQPWIMQDKAKLLPMINIPCIRDDLATPASLCTQDHLQLGQDSISQATRLGQAFYTNTLFDVDGKKPLPTLGLKTTQYIPRLQLDCHPGLYDGAVPQQTDHKNYEAFSPFYSPTLIDINSQPSSSKIKECQSSLKKDTISDTFFDDGSYKVESPHSTLTQYGLLADEEDYMPHSPTTIPPASSQVLIIPERRKPATNRTQRQKGTPTKEGASGYWGNSTKQPTSKLLSTMSSPQQPHSPIVSLFSSLFKGDSSPSKPTQPAITKPDGPGSSKPTTSKARDDDNGPSTSTQQHSMQLNSLSMKSLSIEDDDFDYDRIEHESLTPYTVSPKTIVGVKRADQSPLPSESIVKKPAFFNNIKPPLKPSSSLKGKQKAVMPQQVLPFSPGNNIRDFLAYRKVKPVCSSDLLGGSKLKRSWCDLDDPDFSPRKEKWKWTSGKKP
ncbi:hypothetical protein [Absidia glauca]|uniref:Uncharacterized protein n=1 Tax=Absidia glauca TaxID=4829 RepID=A0A168MLK7_ABSGL|nr:hypothetical protein [Absidia glauca]